MKVNFKKTVGWVCFISLIMVLYNCEVNMVGYDQPYMQTALRHLELASSANMISEKVVQLEKAKSSLNQAKRDKGGHRAAAIRKIDLALMKINHDRPMEADVFIREAIEQVNLGIEVAATR